MINICLHFFMLRCLKPLIVLSARADRKMVNLYVYLRNFTKKSRFYRTEADSKINTHCAWAGGTCVNYPDFFLENHQFHVIYCVTLAY